METSGRFVSVRMSADETLLCLYDNDNRHAYIFASGVGFTKDAEKLASDIQREKDERKAASAARRDAKAAKMSAFRDKYNDTNIWSLWNAYATAFGKPLEQAQKFEDREVEPTVLKDAGGNPVMVDVPTPDGGTVRLKSAILTDDPRVVTSFVGIRGKFTNAKAFEGCHKFEVPNGLHHKEEYFIEGADRMGYRVYDKDTYWVSKDMGVMMTHQPRWKDNIWKEIYTIEFTGLVDYDTEGAYVGPREGVDMPKDGKALLEYIRSINNTPEMMKARGEQQGKFQQAVLGPAKGSAGVDSVAGGPLVDVGQDPAQYLRDAVDGLVGGVLDALSAEQSGKLGEYVGSESRSVFYFAKVMEMFNEQYGVTMQRGFPLSGFHDDHSFRYTIVKKETYMKDTLNWRGQPVVVPQNPLRYADDLYKAYSGKLFAAIPEVYSKYVVFDADDRYITYKLNNQCAIYNLCYSTYDEGSKSGDDWFLSMDNGKIQDMLVRIGKGIIPIR